MKSSICELLSSILARRLKDVKYSSLPPNRQHDVRSGRSTMMACRTTLDEIDNALKRRRQSLYAVFVDSKAAVDLSSRAIVLNKLASSGLEEDVRITERYTSEEPYHSRR